MIELEAISFGFAVPRHDFNTTVHSVFPEAANLRSGRGNRLLTLLAADCGDLPQGIRIKTPPGFSFEMELHPGERIACRSRVLVDEDKHLSVNLRQAKRWKCKLPELGVNEITPAVDAAMNSIWQALNDRQRSTGSEVSVEALFHPDNTGRATVTEIMGALIHELVEAVRNLDPSIETSVSGLIGLGAGLTPSGDDFLVGFLTGLHCTIGGKEERLVFLTELGKMVNNLSRQTNDISQTYLFQATRGQVSSRLVALVEAIARGEDSDCLLQVAEDAMRVGHSSGMHTVTGLLVGLSIWGIRLR